CSRDPLHLPSFPTRRSSDLAQSVRLEVRLVKLPGPAVSPDVHRPAGVDGRVHRPDKLVGAAHTFVGGDKGNEPPQRPQSKHWDGHLITSVSCECSGYRRLE